MSHPDRPISNRKAQNRARAMQLSLADGLVRSECNRCHGEGMAANSQCRTCLGHGFVAASRA